MLIEHIGDSTEALLLESILLLIDNVFQSGCFTPDFARLYRGSHHLLFLDPAQFLVVALFDFLIVYDLLLERLVIVRKRVFTILSRNNILGGTLEERSVYRLFVTAVIALIVWHNRLVANSLGRVGKNKCL